MAARLPEVPSGFTKIAISAVTRFSLYGSNAFRIPSISFQMIRLAARHDLI